MKDGLFESRPTLTTALPGPAGSAEPLAYEEVTLASRSVPTSVRRAKKVLGFGAALLVTGMLCLEVATQAFFWWRSGMTIHRFLAPWERNYYIGAIYKPNIAFGGFYRTNSLGLRGAEIDRVKRAGTIRIVALGESTTFGPYLPLEQTYPYLLEEMLRRRYPGRAFEVINAGIPMWTTAESLINFALRLVDYRPDIVLIYQGANDLRADWYEDFQPDYSHIRYLDAQVYEHPLANFGTYWFYRRFVLKNERRKARVEAYPSTGSLKRNLSHLVTIAQAHRMDVILSTIALSFDESLSVEQRLEAFRKLNRWYAPPNSLEEFERGLGLHNAAIRELAQERGVPLVDNAREFPKGERFFQDELHFTFEGNRVLAANFLRAIETNGLIERRLAQHGPGTQPPRGRDGRADGGGQR